MNDFFLIISARKSFSSRSICDKFIFSDKDSKFCPLWSLCRYSVKPQLNFQLRTLSQTFYWRKAITFFQIWCSSGMVTDNLCCQLRKLSQKIKTYQFCNPMKLTFCDFLQRISGFIYLYSDTFQDLNQGKKIMIRTS